LDKKNVYCVILAGGKGERLWPLSKQNLPKQFIPFRKGNSLLEETIDRVDGFIQKNNIFIVTNNKYEKIINNLVGDKIGGVFSEPESRNTAPAIALSCLKIYEKNPEAYIIFLSADHYIPEKEKFVNGLKNIISTNTKEIVILGVVPQYPAIGYGYIEFENDTKNNHLAKVVRFHEKPSYKQAKIFTQNSNMLWNIGMFCGKAESFIKSFNFLSPDIIEDVKSFLNGKKEYKNINSISIDYAIMEKSKNLLVLPMDIVWFDVGSIDSFLSLKGDTEKNVMAINAKNNLVDVDGKLTVLIGVDDICVVQTEKVLLVMKKGDSDKIKSVLSTLRLKNEVEYL
jgi:mannose-1-phosphate guanylyltransferase